MICKLMSSKLNCSKCYILAVDVMKEETLLFKNKYVFLFFRKGLKLLCCVRQRDVGRQDRFLYWPMTSSLDHSTLCYLQDPLSTSSVSRPGFLNRRPGMDHRLQWARSQWLQAGFDSGLHCLELSQMGATQLEAASPSGAPLLTANWLSLWPSLSPTDTTVILFHKGQYVTSSIAIYLKQFN